MCKVWQSSLSCYWETCILYWSIILSLSYYTSESASCQSTWEAAKDGFLSSTWETHMEFLVPDLDLAQSWQLQVFEK